MAAANCEMGMFISDWREEYVRTVVYSIGSAWFSTTRDAVELSQNDRLPEGLGLYDARKLPLS